MTTEGAITTPGGLRRSPPGAPAFYALDAGARLLVRDLGLAVEGHEQHRRQRVILALLRVLDEARLAAAELLRPGLGPLDHLDDFGAVVDPRGHAPDAHGLAEPANINLLAHVHEVVERLEVHGLGQLAQVRPLEHLLDGRRAPARRQRRRAHGLGLLQGREALLLRRRLHRCRRCARVDERRVLPVRHLGCPQISGERFLQANEIEVARGPLRASRRRLSTS